MRGRFCHALFRFLIVVDDSARFGKDEVKNV
jgi:hypothetical protein